MTGGSERPPDSATPAPRPLRDALQRRRPDSTPLPLTAAVAVLIADARVLADAEARGTVLPRETDPAYNAPEQTVDGGGDERRARLYGWGAMAYTLLAGKHPFASSVTGDALAAAHRAETPAPLVLVGRDVPHDVATVVMRCLAKDPDERPESAQDVVHALERAATELAKPPVHATRRRLRFIGSALGMLVAAGAMAISSGLLVDQSGATWSVAVLPFEHVGDTAQYAATRALGDALTGRLAGIADLTVIDAGSAAEYAGTAKTAAQIGDELAVSYLLRGSVTWTRADDGGWRGTIRPQLVNVRDGRTAWRGGTIDVTAARPFDAERAIAERVLDAIGMEIDSTARAVLDAAPARNADASLLYWRARSLLRGASWRSSGDTTAAARDSTARAADATRLLQGAVRLDSTFARAHAALALLAARDAIDTTRYARAVQEALALDSTLPDAHRARAVHLWFVRARFIDALAAAEQAGETRPADAELLELRGTFRVQSGDGDAGVADLVSAALLDPRDARLQATVAAFAWRARRHDDAERHARRAIALAPTEAAGHRLLVASSLARGDTVAARRALDAGDSTLAGRLRDAALFRLLSPAWAGATSPGDSARGRTGAGTGDSVPAPRMARTPSSALDLVVLGAWHREARRDTVARAYFDTALTMLAASRASDASPTSAAHRAIALAGTGRADDARRAVALADSLALSGRPGGDIDAADAQQSLAYAELLLGEIDAVLTRLTRVLARPSGITPVLLREMWPFASLQGDARFARLVAPDQPAQ